MDIKHPIDSAADIVGSQAALAGLLGVTKAAVNQWKTEGRRVPFEHCASIELKTDGKVTRRDLRPADWWLHWPELITAEHPAPEPAANAA